MSSSAELSVESCVKNTGESLDHISLLLANGEYLDKGTEWSSRILDTVKILSENFQVSLKSEEPKFESVDSSLALVINKIRISVINLNIGINLLSETEGEEERTQVLMKASESLLSVVEDVEKAIYREIPLVKCSI